MRTTSAATGALAFGLMLSAASQPTMAGPACNELGLGSPCVRSNDIRANLTLGGSTGDGRLQLQDDARVQGVQLRATTGNVINRFSNEEDQSNGLVKAWAQINADGTIAACWRCNTDTAETRRFSPGNTRSTSHRSPPTSPDGRGQQRSTTSGDGTEDPGSITLADREFDASSVYVNTTDADGTESNRSLYPDHLLIARSGRLDGRQPPPGTPPLPRPPARDAGRRRNPPAPTWPRPTWPAWVAPCLVLRPNFSSTPVGAVS